MCVCVCVYVCTCMLYTYHPGSHSHTPHDKSPLPVHISFPLCCNKIIIFFHYNNYILSYRSLLTVTATQCHNLNFKLTIARNSDSNISECACVWELYIHF